MAALQYLRTDLSVVTNHSDEISSAEFRKLASEVFVQKEEDPSEVDLRGSRSKLFEELCIFYPEEMTEPKEDLVDFVWQEEEEDGLGK